MGIVDYCHHCLFRSYFRFETSTQSLVLIFTSLTPILDDGSGSSPCEGRVEVTYGVEDDTRKLAIVIISPLISTKIFCVL